MFFRDIWYSIRRLWTLVKPVRARWMKLHPDAKIPVQAYKHDAAHDIHSIEEKRIEPGEHCNVDCGIALQVGPGMAYNIRGRSGLTRRGLIAGLGLVDPNYSGSIKVVLSNFSKEAYTVKKGERIAQLQFVYVLDVPLQEVASFKHKPGTRQANGWGSSGTI